MRGSLLLLLLSACTAGVGGGVDAGASAPDVGAANDSGVARDGSSADTLEDASSAPDAEPTDAGGEQDAAAPDLGVPDLGPSGTLVLVAVGYGNRRIHTLDGVTYADDQVVDPNGGDDNNLLRGVGYGEGRFVAVGGGGQGQSWVSDDGRTWSHHQTALRAFLSDAAFGNGRWVAAGGNGLRLRSLDRGESWDGDPGYYAGHYRGIAFGGGVFVAVGHRYGQSSDGLSAVSADGETWEVLEHDGLLGLGGVTFGAGLFLATGRAGRVAVSTDGRTWDEVTVTGTNLDAPTFTEGEFLIPCAEGLLRSSDGRNFTRVDGFAPGGVVYAFGAYRGVSWQSKRYRTTDLSQAWVRTHEDDGPAFTELLLGEVR